MKDFVRSLASRRPEGVERQLTRVQRQANLRWPRHRALLGSALRISPESSVFRGEWEARPVVVKKFWGLGSRRNFVGQTRVALDRLASLGHHPAFTFNELLATSGHLGLVMVSFENGTPVNKLLEEPGVNRKQLIKRCCDWQHWAGQGDFVQTELNADRLAAEINQILQNCGEHRDAGLLAELGSALLDMLGGLAGRPVLYAPGHPDFAPRNFIMREDGVLSAVDIHRAGRILRTRQAAMFVVSKDFREMEISRPLLYGLNRQELRQFLAHGTVPDQEINSLLIFFIGLTYFTMYARNPGKPWKMRVRRRRIRVFLAHLRQGKRILR
ncbi:hypothetical protein [Leisingera sp. McT4-56]|uniref:hypothetical protein n=1 Tax=Leisingera sp. McT4-56 TaxID=2881255 RepID=UPI001CF8945A|nr:hypothetical protein [Leisingera sp. McT4-56]MCB4454756.1 hypothetical protein [Leisingera sp. McT4-56]